MITIDALTVNQALAFPSLINALEQGFLSEIVVPPRLHFDMENPKENRETTLLMMPAWQKGEVAGVKLVTVAPNNAQKNLPSIQGIYLLLDVSTGSPIAMMDAPALTAKRTAAASGLASRILSRENSRNLLVIGTGTLSSQLIEAHCSVRPIKQVKIWGRSLKKAQTVCDLVAHLNIDCQPVIDIEIHVEEADIISCATLSQKPLLFGKWLRAGQHLDMVGAYRPDMREMDDECLLRARVFVDNFDSALRETGDIAIPLSKGVITEHDIEADLFSLCKKDTIVTRQADDITVFKSVGHALEDLIAAKLVAQYVKENAKN
ncbi:MAG: ornithine cyclodeaminase/alanine dehydrogenase-like protein (mu-crystallin family) [Alteromonadaceae bacterium]|jgi:ornithine cyclodeaminase/alanine dehydrogenase-like protein (mu-crystallin family)